MDERARRTTPLLAALAVVGLSAAAVFGFLYLTSDVSSDDVGTALSEETPEVREVSERVANLLLNYDSTNLQEVSDQMLGIATGNFREQYEEVLSSASSDDARLPQSGRLDAAVGPHFHGPSWMTMPGSAVGPSAVGQGATRPRSERACEASGWRPRALCAPATWRDSGSVCATGPVVRCSRQSMRGDRGPGALGSLAYALGKVAPDPGR
jgi:hypothetical protein